MKQNPYKMSALIWLQGAVALLLTVLHMVLPDGRESQLPLLHFMGGFLAGLSIAHFFAFAFIRIRAARRSHNGKV